jgi:excisionase family DNA binding protein
VTPALPSLDTILADPAGTRELSPAAATALLAQCGAVQALLASRLLAAPAPRAPEADGTSRLLPIPAVAALLAVPASYAYELARQGTLPTVRLGKYVRVREADLGVWIAAHATPRVDARSAPAFTREQAPSIPVAAAGPPRRSRSRPARGRVPRAGGPQAESRTAATPRGSRGPLRPQDTDGPPTE